MPRRPRGRPPADVSAEIRSRAIAAVQATPRITGAALAAELEIDPTRARQLLAELRAVDLAPPARTGADGRALAGPPPAPGRVVRIPARVLSRLEQLPGAGTIEQIEAALDAAERPLGQLAIEALTAARVGSVATHTADAPLVRCRMVGADRHQDGSATLLLDVGGTGSKPAWRVVIEVPSSNPGPRAGKD